MARTARPTPSTTTSTRQNSPPPSPISAPSPSFSHSTGDEELSSLSETPNGSQALASASRAGSPPYKLHPESLESDDSVTCQWDDCGIVYRHLPTLIDHIHNDHIGVHKSNYTCEWSSCPRRGLQQTSRFALISHIRSHTGEKPFTCLKPECDKSFTRSDALAKHMRLQHNISPPAPGRGGSRKRKRAVEDQGTGPVPPGQPSPAPSSSGGAGTGGGFNTFKVEPGTPSETDERGEYFMPHPPPMHTNGRSISPRPPLAEDDEQEGYASSEDTLPAHLMPQYEPSTGLVLGRSPSMVMYLLTKAKHRYALTQHEELCEQLRVVRQELKKEREEKENALNLVLRGVFGPEAENVIRPISPPPGMSPEEVQAAITGPVFSATVGNSGGAVTKYSSVTVTNGNAR